jgi:serine protease inhibitor
MIYSLPCLFVTLALAGQAPGAARQDSMLATAGRVDSIGFGLVVTDTATAFTYERFGIGLLRAAVRHSSPDSSRVLSPLSAGQALALLLGAARDSSALAIARGLSLGGLGSDGIAVRSRRFNDAVRARRDVTLKVANALWVDTNETLQPVFARWARTYYRAAVRSVPLHAPSVVAVVNRWADSVTNGAIPKIREQPYGEFVEVVLTNAVYFKGLWLEPFDSAATEDRPFMSGNGVHVSAPTMERTGRLAYRREPGYQALRVPYRAGLTALYIVLPDSGRSAASLLAGLGDTGWPTPDPRTESQAVQLRLPRLHVVMTTDLQPVFTDLDMGILFDPMRADFGGLVMPRPDRPPPCPPLSSGVHLDPCTRYRVSEAAQTVYLDADEKGTEAAAITSMGISINGSIVAPPIQFFVDRPFLFALRDERTGTVLFVGLIAGPRQ